MTDIVIKNQWLDLVVGRLSVKAEVIAWCEEQGLRLEIDYVVGLGLEGYCICIYDEMLRVACKLKFGLEEYKIITVADANDIRTSKGTRNKIFLCRVP